MAKRTPNPAPSTQVCPHCGTLTTGTPDGPVTHATCPRCTDAAIPRELRDRLAAARQPPAKPHAEPKPATEPKA